MTDMLPGLITTLGGIAVVAVPAWLAARSSLRVARQQAATPPYEQIVRRVEALEDDNAELRRSWLAVAWPAMAVLSWVDGGAVPPPPRSVEDLRQALRTGPTPPRKVT